MLLYYITDRSQFSGDEPSRRRQLLETLQQAVRCGIDFVQLREKDLSAVELEKLAREVAAVVQNLRTENPKLKTGLLINSRTDIALACRADGVQLRSDDISAVDVRKIWDRDGNKRGTIGVSCHTLDEVSQAAAQGADFAVFGPIFEKNAGPKVQPAGLDLLREACLQEIPVVAIGGITLDNAESCVQAGAAGIAGIRLFQKDEMARVVRELRNATRQ